ncbi:galactose-binding domain-containing protein [Flavicella sediminum]|uniref:galactose-binding domain-containing protein n=1 Tax=Flavicella sediminum TaxID=2585141 RepID=UPI00111F2654|nr:T9SS type A sorting domain-containing protein [Flavicella sediminum]
MKKINKVFCFSNTTNYLIAFVFFWFQVFGQSITVNSTNYKQTIDMIGGDMERSSIAVQKAKNKEEIFQWSFGDINFNVCRVQYDKNQELTEGVKNWSFYEKQVATMKAIKTINPAIKFFATMRSDYDGFGDDNNMPDWIHTYSTKATNVEKYGIFLADYCEYMSQQGVPISILSTAKEWMWHVRASEAEEIIHTLNTELTNRGVEIPLIIDQGFWSLSAGITYLNNVASLETKDLYSAFCSHNYGNEAPEKWVEIIEKSTALGKSMYDDETSTGSGSPTYGEEREMYKQIAEYIKKAERYKAGLNGEIFFEIWSRGIDKETRAIYYPAKGTGKRLRGYYMMKQFSNNILDHTYVTSSINDMSNVYTISFRKENKMVLWVINKGDTEYTIPIKVDESTITSQVETHYWTNNSPIEGTKSSYIASGNTFTPTVAGESMNCYVFEVTPTIPNLALASRGSVATQSSIAYNGPPELAIDGNTDGSFGNGSVTHTAHTDNPKWWQVDFQGDYSIENIIIYNRTGSNYRERLNNFTVDVIAANGNITFTQVYEDYPNPSMSISLGGVVGSLVRISKSSDNGLTLAEVEVYGEDKMLNIEGFEKNNVQIYPNPIKDFFTITHCKNAEIEIYSTLGKLLYANKIERNTEQIEMKTFKKGVYYTKVNNRGVILIKKIIKE